MSYCCRCHKEQPDNEGHYCNPDSSSFMNNKDANDFIQFHHNPIVAQKNEEIAHLQKLCEEQKGEIIELGKIIEYHDQRFQDEERSNRRLEAQVEEQKGEIERLDCEVKRSCQFVADTNRSNAFREVEMSKLRERLRDVNECLKAELAEKDKEIERLKVYPTAHVYDEHNKKVRILQSQIAEQKEEIEALEERIENLNDLAVIAEGKLATQTAEIERLKGDCHCGESHRLKILLTTQTEMIKELSEWLKSAGESIKDHCSENHAECIPMCGQGYIDKANELGQALSQERLGDGGKEG